MSVLLAGAPPGYFRIGEIELEIPPERIEIGLSVENDEIPTLRASNSKYVKTGHQTLNFAISWKVFPIELPNGKVDYRLFEQLRRIVAYTHVAPFIEIENALIRETVLSRDPQYDPEQRIAVAIRQLHVESSEDIENGWECRLVLSLFNYLPYTPDFSYRGENPDQGYSANESPMFTAFIDEWLEENLNQIGSRPNYPPLQNWRDQEAGFLRLHWREYSAVGAIPPASGASISPSHVPFPQPSGPIRTLPVEGRIKSSFGPRQLNNRSFHDGVDIAVPIGTAVVAQAAGTVKIAGTVTGYGKVIYLDHGNGFETRYAHLSQILVRAGEDVSAGQVIAKSGNTGESSGPHLHYEVRQDGVAKDPLSTPLLAQASFSTPAASRSLLRPDAESKTPVTEVPDGWTLDYFTEDVSFLYRSRQLELNTDSDCQISKISVVFATSLSKIPLANYRFATFQHVGPTSALVQVGFISKPENEDDESEPRFPALAEINGMVSRLESQYHALRGQWRSVASIHRMQATVVENQVLNMLGISGLLVQEFSMETLPTAVMVQASLVCSRYENVFEEIEGYRVKSPADARSEAVNKLLTPEALANPQFSNTLFDPLRQFAEMKQNGDLRPVADWIRRDPSKFPSVPFPVPVDNGDLNRLLNSLDQVGPDGTSFASKHPDYAKRLQSRNSISYNDYLYVTAESDHPEASSFRRKYEAQIRQAGPGANSQILDNYLSQQLSSEFDTPFMTAYKTLAESPYYKDIVEAGSGLDQEMEKNRREHGAYRDLGLRAFSYQGKEYTPAVYFRDYSQETLKKLRDQAEVAADVAAKSSQEFNKSRIPQSTNSDSGSDRQVFSSPTQDSEATKAIARTAADHTVLPFWTMSRAFPAFKILLCEEDNLGPFWAFDDFYSYVSVVDIDIIRYQDRPDTVVLQLTNLAHLFSHKLFDNSVMGKFESSLTKHRTVPTSSTGDPVASPYGNVPAKVEASEDYAGRNTQSSRDLTSGVEGKRHSIPLQYFPLQSGTKIQIRMGFSNDPDKLSPCFNGVVAQVEGDQVLTVVAQGFLLELMQPPSERLDSDGYVNLNLPAQVADRLSAAVLELSQLRISNSVDTLKNAFRPAPAYGGYRIFRESGDTEAVIQKMLKASTAKHFGHWQIDPTTPSYLKGMGWVPLVSEAAASLGMTRVADLISKVRDRSGENILINYYINAGGDVVGDRLIRPYRLEQSMMAPATYSVPDDPNIVPWMVIKDVARRYPEYILAVKPYRYPYAAEATLVFAHPNDFYVAGTPSPTSTEELSNLGADETRQFWAWWKSTGRSLFVNSSSVDADQLEGLPIFGNVSAATYARRRYNGEPSQVLASQNFFDNQKESTAYLAQQIDKDGPAALNKILDFYLEYARLLSSPLLFWQDASARATRQRAQAIRRSLQGFLRWNSLKANPLQTLATQPWQPVRKWILVNENAIVHNGIEIDENFFNAVRVDNHKPFLLSSSIPEQYQRVLNCDPMINSIVDNVRVPNLHTQYATSFLKEQAGRMYSGELVLSGVPEIDPYDVILLRDPSTGTVGPIEVKSVIHRYDLQNGMITIIKPNLLVSVNESVNVCLTGMLDNLFRSLTFDAPRRVAEEWEKLETRQQVEVGLGAVGTAGMAGLAAFLGAPIAIPLGAGAIVALASFNASLNPLFLSPLTRYGRPWIGGLEGWQINDIYSWVGTAFRQFDIYEVKPTLEGFKTLYGAVQAATR